MTLTSNNELVYYDLVSGATGRIGLPALPDTLGLTGNTLFVLHDQPLGFITLIDINTTLTAHIITAGVRYQYELSKRFIPYGELGVSGYIGNVDVSAQSQDINKTGYADAPEISAGFYLPVIIPSNSHTTVGIHFSFGLFRDSLVKAASFDFGYLGKITIDGQRITIGLRVAF